jgi:hypothetical protein
MDKLLSERFEQELDGVLSCYDRVVISGNLQSLCYAQGMTHYLYQQEICIFDYTKFAAPLREHTLLLQLKNLNVQAGLAGRFLLRGRPLATQIFPHLGQFR